MPRMAAKEAWGGSRVDGGKGPEGCLGFRV